MEIEIKNPYDRKSIRDLVQGDIFVADGKVFIKLFVWPCHRFVDFSSRVECDLSGFSNGLDTLVQLVKKLSVEV